MPQPMYAPSANQQYQAKSGTTYTADVNNIIANVAIGDVVSLLNLGCISLDPSGYYVRKVGTFTANGATPVTVVDVQAAVTDMVLFGLNTVGGTVGNTPTVKTLTAGTGYTFGATASDTSVYNYAVLALHN